MPFRVSSAEFVGRSAELAVLESALERASGGATSSVLVGGDAGIGKSRLLSEFEARARATGAMVLVGECVDLAGGELPYGPLVAALRPLVSAGDTGPLASVPGAIRAPLARLWPVAAGSLHGNGSSDDNELGQGQLFEAIHWLIAAAAAESPVVLVLEDLHWADRSTRDLLTFLIRNTRGERVLYIGSYRSDELHRRHPLHPFVSELERSRGAERVELTPFGAREVTAQIAGILGEQPDPALARRLAQRSEGNPFFTEELLAASDEGPMPESLRDVLLMRVERLSAPARDLLALAAAAGRTAGHALLTAASAAEPAEVTPALREAIDQRVLVTAPNGTDYTFRHTLMRDAVYADLLPGERVALHAQLAAAIEADPSLATTGAVAELAHHWHAAGDTERGLAASLEAAAAAESVHAYAEAQLNLERALELWARVPAEKRGDANETEVMARAARAAALAGDIRRAIALETKVLETADGPEAQALSHSRLGRYLWQSGAGDEALRHYETAVEIVPPEPPSRERAQVLAALSHALMLGGELTKTRAPALEALEMARAIGARNIEASVLNTLGPATVGSEIDPLEAVRTAREIAEEIGAVDEIGRSYINECEVLDELGRLEECVAVARRGVARARDLGGSRAWGAFLAGDLADRLHRVGDWDAAVEHSHSIIEGAPTELNAASAHSVLGRVLAERGDTEAADAELDEALRLSGRSGGPMWLGPIHAAMGLARLADGDPEAALKVLRRGLDEVGRFEMVIFIAELHSLYVRACVDVALRERLRGEADSAAAREAAAREAIASFDAVVEGYPPAQHVLQAKVERHAMDAELSRLGEEDPQAWIDVAAEWDELAQPARAATACWRAAAALVAAGERGDEVKELLAAARATAERLGARPLLDEIDSLTRRAQLGDGSTRAAAAPQAELGLTPREHDVLLLVAAGRTNREIGQELYMSEKTASVHVSRILQKLGVSNRAEAAGVAHTLGIRPASA